MKEGHTPEHRFRIRYRVRLNGASHDSPQRCSCIHLSRTHHQAHRTEETGVVVGDDPEAEKTARLDVMPARSSSLRFGRRDGLLSSA